MDEKKGDKAFKKAKEQITISIFNWSKDYTSAASTFDEAFKIYQSCGAYQKAVNTLKELIVCNQKLTDSWAMARNYQSMVDIYLDKLKVEYPVLKEAITLGFIQFRMAESLDKGLQMVTRATKKLQGEGKKKQAMELLQEAYQIASQDQKSFKKKEIFANIIESFIENEMYQETIKMYYEDIQRKNGSGCQSQALIIIILYILQGEIKRAETQLFQLGNLVPTWLTSDDAESAENLIKFYKQGSPQKFKKETTKASITTLFPIVIIRKLRNVVVPTAQKLIKGNEDEKQEMMEKIMF